MLNLICLPNTIYPQKTPHAWIARYKLTYWCHVTESSTLPPDFRKLQNKNSLSSHFHLQCLIIRELSAVLKSPVIWPFHCKIQIFIYRQPCLVCEIKNVTEKETQWQCTCQESCKDKATKSMFQLLVRLANFISDPQILLSPKFWAPCSHCLLPHLVYLH